MARQYVIGTQFGSFVINETGSNQYVVNTIAVNETSASGNVYNDSVSEILAAGETLSATLTFNDSVTESGSAADTLSSSAIFLSSVAETLSVTETLTASLTILAAVAETLSATETLTGTLTLAGSVAEVLAALEVVTSGGGSIFHVTVAETGALADTVTDGSTVLGFSVCDGSVSFAFDPDGVSYPYGTQMRTS